MTTTADEGAATPKKAAAKPADPAPAPKVRLLYHGSSGRLVDEQSGTEFIRDGDPVEVDAEVAKRLMALPYESFTIETQE